MSGKLKYEEIMSRVEYLENDSGIKALHERARRSWGPLIEMTHKADLPDFMTRGVTVAMPSPRLIDVIASLVADMASYKSITTVAAHGKDGPPTGDQKKAADKVERWLSVLRAQWNEAGRLRMEALQQQLGGAYFVAILECGDPASKNPWSVFFPAFDSCFFPVNGAPDRPKMFCRRYRQMVREAESKYSEQPRTDHYRDKLKMRSGKWKWEAVGADRSVEDGSMATGGDPKYGEEMEFVYYADEEYIYHIAMNDDGQYGEIVFCEKNLTGGGPALVISGASTPSRNPSEMLGPALKPVMQTVLNRNLIRSIRATKSMNARPDMLIEMTPEAFAQSQSAGLITQVQMVEGTPNMISVGGKPTPWAMTPDVDIEELDKGWAEEEHEYIAAWKEPSDPSTVANATANAYLTAVEAIRRRQTPLLKDGDWLETQLCKMVLASLKHYGRDYDLFASGSVTLGSSEIRAGAGVSLGSSDLEDDFEVFVTTRAVTQSEQRAREELGMQRVAWGVGTLEEVVESAYVDSTEQLKKLAIDAGIRLVKPLMLVQLDQTWRDKTRLRSGILLPPGVPTAPPPGAGEQVGQSPMQPAAISGPGG